MPRAQPQAQWSNLSFGLLVKRWHMSCQQDIKGIMPKQQKQGQKCTRGTEVTFGQKGNLVCPNTGIFAPLVCIRLCLRCSQVFCFGFFFLEEPYSSPRCRFLFAHFCPLDFWDVCLLPGGLIYISRWVFNRKLFTPHLFTYEYYCTVGETKCFSAGNCAL